jgi:hypothetical protein
MHKASPAKTETEKILAIDSVGVSRSSDEGPTLPATLTSDSISIPDGCPVQSLKDTSVMGEGWPKEEVTPERVEEVTWGWRKKW